MAVALGLPDDDAVFPAVVAFDPMRDHAYPLDPRAAVHPDAVERLVMAVLQGEATPGEVFPADAQRTDRVRDEL